MREDQIAFRGFLLQAPDFNTYIHLVEVLKVLCDVTQLFRDNNRLFGVLRIGKKLRISLTLAIGYVTIALLSSPTNGNLNGNRNASGHLRYLLAA